MIQINLLPVRQIKQRNKARQEVMALVVAFFFVLGIIAVVGLRQANTVTSLHDEITRLGKEKEQYQATVDQIEKIKKEQKIIETKLATIKGLKAVSQLPARVVDEIANLTSIDRMWLTSFDYTGEVITIAGTALDNATIAEYMDKVAASDYFVANELISSSLIKVGNQKLKSFSMTINVLPAVTAPAPTPAPAQPPVAKK